VPNVKKFFSDVVANGSLVKENEVVIHENVRDITLAHIAYIQPSDGYITAYNDPNHATSQC